MSRKPIPVRAEVIGVDLAPGGHLARSGDIFDCHDLGVSGSSNGEKPARDAATVYGTAPTTEDHPARNVNRAQGAPP